MRKTKRIKKSAFVIWAKEVKLSEFLAKALGAELVVSFVPTFSTGEKMPVWLRYIFQAKDTWQRLSKIKPAFVYVQNPPIFATLVVWIYSLLNGCRFGIDTHTAGFLDRKWVFFHPLHRFLARRATINTVHNYRNLEILKKWKIKNGKVLQFYSPKKEELLSTEAGANLPIEDLIANHLGLKVFMVNRFATDDAWREVIATAKKMPQALFFITGSFAKIKNIEKEVFPENVVLTGYLKHADFIALMEKCDVVLALTKRADTVLWSVREALALAKPLVISDSEVLRFYFSSMAVFSDHQPTNLVVSILLAYKKRDELKEKMESFFKKDRIRWTKDIRQISKAIFG